MTVEERCQITELRTGECSHCLGQDKEPKPRATGPTIAAKIDSTCYCGCKDRIGVGDRITHSTDAGGWCLTEHLQS